MAKKMTKKIEDGAVIMTMLEGEQGEQSFNFDELPAGIKEKFGPFGLSHKLGDAAAGRSGTDAEVAVAKVWEGLMAGNWTVRAPAGPKVSMADISTKYSAMTGEEKDAAKDLLLSLGIKIPGLE